ncbi:MAG: hypothetical protein DMG65_26785 [Candidatus Angelobacter sp. Gp1-AA117]|nr:MAG: hypothetical protein DMG65_26785 [Candidatus Angelobacter sp. Gp1-AA117]
MQDIRNLLRQRLGAIPEPQAHPDPDILSAYAEQVLTPAERNKIQDHLAACFPCREVVALSLPQLQDEQVVLRPAARSWALGFRWAALAAMIVVIIGLAVWQPWREERPSFTTASNTPAKTADTTTAATTISQPAAPPSSAAPAAPAAAPGSPAVATRGESQPGLTARRPQSEPLRDKSSAVLSSNFGGSQPSEMAKTMRSTTIGGRIPGVAGPANMAANNNLATNNAAANNSHVALNSSNNVEVSASRAEVSAPTPKTPALLTADAFTPSRAVPPISAANIGSIAMGVTTDPQNKPVAAAPAPPQPSPGKLHQAWTFVLKAPGKVAGAAEKTEPSAGAGANAFAAGRVRFDPHSALSDHANSRVDAIQIHSSQLHWSISPEGKLIKSETRDQWHEAYPQDQDLQFRTVWTDPNGHEIWAGGSHLTIIHSWNGGVNWQKMQLDQAVDSGDITNISIDDGSVLVKTSNGQTFVSHDKGATWVPLKQNQPAQQPK